MPRGGPDAPWWDRLYETDRPEYIDLPSRAVEAGKVLRGLDRFQLMTRAYRVCSRLTLAEAAGVERPRILELGAGRGRLTQRLLADCPTARVTVSDVSAESVKALDAGPLGSDPRVDLRVVDATDIDAPDDSWDVAVFCMALHHLTPDLVRKLMAEGTRVARRLLIIDGWRNPGFLAITPLFVLTGGLTQAHDGVISLRKCYSARAVEAMAAQCPVPVSVRCRFSLPGYLVASLAAAPATRPDADRAPDRA
ncbi:class I SAM-dependent methyltransferase [Streptomyces sp. AV19]|uniref:class I SAM-dependent methyltransferase n=1 Tax=Streptomyces sp. AV19 TaxID=2793068 RepID=UPI0018FE8FD1|nr:class I SAM-dependent methyltransferase [Streptomyces sp. AV19]MBH1932987.1 class I SAM-dependent methyltransferase [Streptomyces sp. AV19]MDG4533840.1 class I SAM-dependent methyltransferase [Streptomyces sp. AV19]